MNIINKNYLGVGLVGLAIIVLWTFGVPEWNRISLLKDAVEEREGILSARESILTKIEDLNKQYRERTSDVVRISSIVPGTKSTAELVSTIEAITQQTGLQLVEITIGGDGNKQQEPQTMSVELGLAGTYPSLTAFLDLAEKNLRIIDIFEINISQTVTTETQTALNFRIKANVYYLNVK